jgi:hypothetical protein
MPGPPTKPARGSLALSACLLAGVLAAACGGGPEAVKPATTPQTLTAVPATVWVQPGEMGSLTFELLGPTSLPVPGATVSFAIIDDPETPGSEALGATLVAPSATTDVRGQVMARVTGGSPTVFRVRASVTAAMGEAVIVVAAGGVGAVDVAPFFAKASGTAASARTIEVFFFDNSACKDIPARHPPQPARRMRALATSATGTGPVTRYEFVSTALGHAILARAVDARGSLLALGCVDLPGPALVAGGAVQVAVPLADVGPDAVGRFSATTTLEIAPPLAAAEGIAAIWRDLTDCPLDPAQRWLDCTIDALGPASAADPLDCVPATAAGGEGTVGDALSALRGTFLAGADGMPTACRGTKASASAGAVSVDAMLAGLFGSPRPAAFVRLEAAADDAAKLFDDLRLKSTLVLGATTTSTTGAITATHTLDAVTFSLPGASTDVALLPLGLPVLTATPAATIQDDTLTLGGHAFTVRLGTAGRAAFGTLGLARRALPANSDELVDALAALARRDDDANVTGCIALDATLCPRIALAPGCLLAACTRGLDALATRLDASFELADGTDLDLYLSGQAPLLDTHGNGQADRLGDSASGAGKWTVDLRPRGGRRAMGASWEAIRTGN